MMTNCTDGCYWELHVLPRRFFRCSNCGRILNLLKAEAMLNEHAALKRFREIILDGLSKGTIRQFKEDYPEFEAILADTQERE